LIDNKCHREALAQFVAEIVVHRDKLVVRLKSDHADEASGSLDDQPLTVPCGFG
jgi:site-specific DNA recombinase